SGRCGSAARSGPPRPREGGRHRRAGGGGPCGIAGTGEDRPPRPGSGAVAGPRGLGGRGRREPDGGVARRRRLRGDADPAHAGRHDAGPAGGGAGGQHRDGRDRQVRAAVARGEGGMMSGFATIDEAIEEIRHGRILVVVDDEDRENEGDLVMAADKITPEAVNFMVTHARGLMCVPMLGERLDELKLGMMVAENTAPMGTAFTISVDARRGITTGISAYDRAVTIRALVDPQMTSADLVTPGHMFPLRAMEGGVLRRAGHTEAAVDLARMAGCYPAGVICEVLDETGGMARLTKLSDLARRHGLKLITIKDLIEYRTQKEKLVRRVATSRLPTDYGEFTAIAYEATVYSRVHFALVMGNVAGDDPVLGRLHSEGLTGDGFHSIRCDCGPQLNMAMAMVQKEGRGVV